MTGENMTTAAARADLCRFLAGCYYQPGPEFMEERLFDSMSKAASLIDPELAAGAARLGEHFASAGIESLLVDYTRLFLGPTDILAKPYGSAWLTGEKTLMQDSTMNVVELYREGGFELDDCFRELPDHVAVELEFLYLLIFREHQAILKNEPSALASLSSLKKRYLARHLGRWMPQFAAAIERGASSAFYRELAMLTHRFVEAEIARVDA
jgi:TorA maturation chaperone TorD